MSRVIGVPFWFNRLIITTFQCVLMDRFHMEATRIPAVRLLFLTLLVGLVCFGVPTHVVLDQSFWHSVWNLVCRQLHQITDIVFLVHSRSPHSRVGRDRARSPTSSFAPSEPGMCWGTGLTRKPLFRFYGRSSWIALRCLWCRGAFTSQASCGEHKRSICGF